MRLGLRPATTALPLWVGTGIHFALEDFHGYNVYDHPRKAFLAYVAACRKTPRFVMPDNWEAEASMVLSMMDYYPKWLETREPLQTFMFDGVPQVEVAWEVDLGPMPIHTFAGDAGFEVTTLGELARKWGYSKVTVAGRFDRVVIDEHQRLWVWELKSAKKMRVLHFMNDLQVTMYAWAVS